MHLLPKNAEVREKWLQAIFGDIPEYYNRNMALCSSHFEEDDFANLREFNWGFATRLKLKRGAVPSRLSVGSTTSSAHSVQVTFDG